MLITYAINLLVAGSVFFNALLAGPQLESFCARAARAKRAGKRWGRIFCDVVNLVDPGHCERSLRWWERQ